MRKFLIVGWIGWVALLLIIIHYFGMPCNDNTIYNIWSFPKESHPSVIFFVLQPSSSALNSRQACAVESAARHHLQSKVNVFVVSSAPTVDSFYLNHTLSNINLIEASFDEIFEGTPLRQLYRRVAKENGSDLYLKPTVPFLLTWKFGGIYLDTDVIALRNLQYFRNFVIEDTDPSTTVAMFGFEKNHPFLSLCLEFLDNYKDRKDVISRTLTNYCEVDSPKDIKDNRCDVDVLPSSSLFPVSSDRWPDYFSTSKLPYLLQRIEDSHAIYLNHKQSRDVRVPLGSGTALEEVMRSNCPLIYDHLARHSGYI